MGKLRHRILPTESLIEQHVERSRGQPLLTTNDVGDLHQMVVDDIGQMIGGQLVCTLEEHLIVEDIRLHTNLTTNQVVDQHLLSSLDLETDHILLAVGYQLLHFFFRKCQRVAHLATGVAVILEILDFSTLGFQLLWGIKGNIGLIGIEQLLHIFLIDIATLTLAIGTFVATEGDTLVELNAQPLERLDDIFLGTRHETVRIGVLDTENEVTAMLLGKEVIIQGGTHTTDM